MDWRTADSSVAVAVNFLVDGEFALPDTGSLTLTLRGNDGSVLSGYNELPLVDVTTSTMLLKIPAEANGIGSNALETRYVRVSYSVGNTPLAFEYAYRLTPFLPIAANAQAVRSVLGLDIKALPDADVDLYEAYYKLKAESYGADFVTSLTSGSLASVCANNMIALEAAILLMPSMQNRVMKSETSHNEIYIRNALDVEELSADLASRLQEEVTAMQNALNGTSTVTASLPIFLTSSPVDVITGA